MLEESPSPALDPAARAAMSEAAAAFARAIGYRGAGTAEFVLDADRDLRLPGAERPHPGRASGHRGRYGPRPRRAAAADRRRRRRRGSEPQRHLRGPRGRGAPLCGGSTLLPAAGGPDRAAAAAGRVRVDAGVAEGDEVGTGYDPMIAKLIAHAPTREAALDRLAVAPGRDRGGGRDDEPAVPPLARRAPGSSRGRDDDRVPRRASAALAVSAPRGRPGLARRLAAQPPTGRDGGAARRGRGSPAPRARGRQQHAGRTDARHGARGGGLTGRPRHCAPAARRARGDEDGEPDRGTVRRDGEGRARRRGRPRRRRRGARRARSGLALRGGRRGLWLAAEQPAPRRPAPRRGRPR